MFFVFIFNFGEGKVLSSNINPALYKYVFKYIPANIRKFKFILLRKTHKKWRLIGGFLLSNYSINIVFRNLNAGAKPWGLKLFSSTRWGPKTSWKP